MTSELMAAAVEIAEREKAARCVAILEEQVEAAFSAVGKYPQCQEYTVNYGEPPEQTIRSYISSLEAENARLKAEAERSQWQPIETAPEGETLMVERECGGFWWGARLGNIWRVKYGRDWPTVVDVIAWQYLPKSYKDALAPLPEPPAAPEPQVCEACGGSKLVKSDTSPCHVTCPTCNGTGAV
jgi:hypothetical protein